MLNHHSENKFGVCFLSHLGFERVDMIRFVTSHFSHSCQLNFVFVTDTTERSSLSAAKFVCVETVLNDKIFLQHDVC